MSQGPPSQRKMLLDGVGQRDRWGGGADLLLQGEHQHNGIPPYTDDVPGHETD